MVRYHGNWCGPNWTAGQDKPASELTLADRRVPAIDGLDDCCKRHDIGIHDAQTAEEISEVNARFMEEASEFGYKGRAAAALVGLFGPSQPNPTPSATMPSKRLRGNSDDPEELERTMREYDRTRDPTLPSYEDIEAEDERQAKEDADIRDVLLGMRSDGSPDVRPAGGRLDRLPISPAGRPLSNRPDDSNSFRNLNDPNEVNDFNNNRHTGGNPFARGMGDTPMAEAPAAAERSSNVMTSTARSGGFDARTVTPIANIAPSRPYHNTEQAILEYHGSASVNEVTAAAVQGNTLKIRMNTYVAPFSETVGISTAVDQNAWTRPTFGISRQIVGRYASVAGNNGNVIDANFHRNFGNAFDDPLFASPATTPFTGQKCSGAEYYKLHHKAYTVTKCEWTLYVHYPYHCLYGIDSTNDNPDAGQIQTAMENSHMGHSTSTPGNFAKVRVFTHYTTEGGTITPINPPLNRKTIEMERWFNVYDNKETVGPNQVKVLRGTWVPGMVQHNPLSDNDVEVWSPIDVVPPSTHLEHVVIQFKRSANSSDATNDYRLCCNFSINLKYHVQFKEPITEIQYPFGGQTNPTGTSVNVRLLQTQSDLNT